MKTATQHILQIFRKQTFFYVKESSPVAYGDGFTQFPDEKDLVKAHLLVELIERYHYRAEKILVGMYLPVNNNSVDYAEIDIVVQDNSYNPFILCMVELPQTYEQNLAFTMRRLFAMAVLMRETTPSTSLRASSPRYLMYYTRWYEEGSGVRKTSQIIVDLHKYQTFDAWHSAGSPKESNLPQNQS